MSTWIVGDIHGCYREFMALLQHPEIAPDDSFILIGDIIDRGPDSVKMLEWAMHNITPGGKYQMILGNHEDNILQDYLNVSLRNDDTGTLPIDTMHCHYDFVKYMKEAGFKTVADIEPVIQWMSALPLYAVGSANGNDYIIVHGWVDGLETSRETLLWGRDVDDYNRFLPDYVPQGKEILIHGHTPTLNINGYPENGRVFFREHSINVDCGCVYQNYNGRLAALRLEDQKVIYQERLK